MNRTIPLCWIGCVAMACLLTPSSAVMARGKQVTIDFSGTSVPSSPLPASIRTIEVRRPSYDNRGSDNGFMYDDYQQRAIRHPSSHPYYWWWRWSGYRNGVSTQLQEDSSYRKLLGKIRDRVQSSDSAITLLEVEDASIGADEHDRRWARGEVSGRHQQSKLSLDAYIVVRIGMDMKEESARRSTRVDKQIAGNFARRFTGGLVGGTGSRERQMVRILSMTVDMKLVSYSSGALLASYADSTLAKHHERFRGHTG